MKHLLLLALLTAITNADTKSDTTLHTLLMQNTAKGKTHLPQRVGKNITVTNVDVENTTQITTYMFDISDAYLEETAKKNNKTKKNINTQMSGIMKKDFITRACKSLANPMSLLAMGATYKSNFYSSDKVLQFTYSFSKKDCK